MTSADWAALAAGFGGALLGSGISAYVSWLLLRETSKETLKRDKEARDREIQSHATSLMMKASLLLSDVVAVQRSIDESLSEANALGLTSKPLWQRVLPMVGAEKHITLEPLELGALIEAGANDLVYEATDLFQLHPVLVQGIILYNSKRSEVRAISDMNEDAGGGVLNTALTASQVGKLAPLSVELESLIKQIREMLPVVQKKAEAVTYGIGPAMRTRYQSSFPILAPKGTAAAAAAKTLTVK